MIKKTLIITLIVLIGYSVYMVAVPHYNYFAFKSDLEKYVRVAINIPKQVREDVYEMVDQYDIPVQKDKISITQDGGRIYRIRLSWSVTVDFFTLYQKTFHFRVDTGRS